MVESELPENIEDAPAPFENALGLDLPPENAEPAANQPYRVLARKYRPQTFAELIGQNAMVQTLANAIRRERLAHAFLMTGVRGVGKTSTARLMAKSLNCVGPDGRGGPTISPCGICEPCQAIAEGRHIDVIEMDAASNTSVDDVREIIEAVRYAAVSARYKIYIIDEVHMLSKNAFNALLKTLEEPPGHVKFIFATTEVGKVPITILSRCQRFDLKRIPANLLSDHFMMVSRLENIEAEPEAIGMIATAADGSVRDGLSILDQAIAHADLDGDGRVSASKVREMLGLADKSAVRRLFGHLLAGEAQSLLDAVAKQHALGVEPAALVRSLMDLVHKITLAGAGASLPEIADHAEEAEIRDWAGQLGKANVHRLWQLLLKGLEEVARAPQPQAALDMALLRAMVAGQMPDPGELVRRIAAIEGGSANSEFSGVQNGQREPGSTPTDHAAEPVRSVDHSREAPPSETEGKPNWQWPELIEQLRDNGYLHLAQTVHDWLRPIETGPAKVRYAPSPGMSRDPASELREALYQLTGQRWEIVCENTGGEPTLLEREQEKQNSARREIEQSPLVRAALDAFPDSHFVNEDSSDPPWLGGKRKFRS